MDECRRRSKQRKRGHLPRACKSVDAEVEESPANQDDADDEVVVEVAEEAAYQAAEDEYNKQRPRVLRKSGCESSGYTGQKSFPWACNTTTGNPSSCSQTTLISSMLLLSVEKQRSVTGMSSRNGDEDKDLNALYWRQTFDVSKLGYKRKGSLSALRKHCICRKEYNPDKTMFKCMRAPECGIWKHLECLEGDLRSHLEVRLEKRSLQGYLENTISSCGQLGT
jgi:hypothetical protein